MFGSLPLPNILDFILRNSVPQISECNPCSDIHFTEIGQRTPIFSCLRLTI